MLKPLLLYTSFSSLLVALFLLSVFISDKFKGPNISDVGVAMYPNEDLAFGLGFFCLQVAIAALAYGYTRLFKINTTVLAALAFFFSCCFGIFYYFLRMF